MLRSTKKKEALSVEWKETLRDGTQVVIRPMSASDRELERSFIETMSPDARRFRFLDTMKSPSPALLTQLTAIDPATDFALIALLVQPGSAQATEVGVARFSANADGSDCEFAIAVADAWQRRGLGTLLTHRVMLAAEERGIAAMHAISAPDNAAMRGLGESLGFRRVFDPDGGLQVIYRTELPYPAEAV